MSFISTKIYAFRKSLKHHLILILFTSVIFPLIGIFIITHASLSTTPSNSLFSSIPTTTAINPSDTSQTATWNTVSQKRKTLSFSVKSPPDWAQPFDHCNSRVIQAGYNISPGCVKVVVFTDIIPADDDSGNGRKLKLASMTKTTIQGFTALRKIYTLSGSPYTPDTYQVWLYSNDHPFMLILAWIGVGTDSQSANNFVKSLDSMVSTIQLQR